MNSFQDLRNNGLGKCTITEKCRSPLSRSGLGFKMRPVILVGSFFSAVVED